MERRARSVRTGQILAAVCATVWTAACTESDAPGGGDVQPPTVPAEVLAALQRDLGQTAAQIERRLIAEAEATVVEPHLRAALGDGFGGAWMDADGSRLLVGVTDPARADEVRAAGAEPRLVRHSVAELEAVQARLDRAMAAGLDGGVHSWHVDVAGNRVVIAAADPAAPAIAALRAQLGVAADAVEVVASAERPRPLYDVRGGDEIILNSNTLCSMGFAVERGYVTAGHCGRVGTPTAGSNWVASGTVRGSTFPGNDYAWVELNGSWTSLAQVNNYAGGVVQVAGSAVASVGSSVCRSGRTTGWRCGVIQAHNVTINYADGPVYGATQTTTCAEGGDSGGAFISGNQAQGVTSGGSGNCSTGGTTFYQPLNPILSVYGLTLKTSGGGGSGRAIVSRLNGKCIDVPGANFVDGAPLQMWGCNGTAAQQWTFTGGTVRAGGKCMDVAWANPADGTAVQLVNCNGNVAQQFVLNGAGDLVSVLANKCVDIGGWNGNDGARLIIWPCHGGANQKWDLR
ncbi:MAG TPA: ricin-type beta-trefoil lectin domain protein [Kofleriaceae bacterium]|nr:ricin-type beta-trefoil lectin domain protein [Kofleriaceae bacterium]